jgi:hypothetical protein
MVEWVLYNTSKKMGRMFCNTHKERNEDDWICFHYLFSANTYMQRLKHFILTENFLFSICGP